MSGDGPAENPPLAGVLAIRHAPTAGDGMCVGDADIASPMPANQVGARMRALLPECDFVRVWTSPLARCISPARVLAGELGVPLQVDERLREICLGIWQGQPWAAIEANDPTRFQHWMANWADTAPPGGESLAGFRSRVGSWWSELSQERHLLVAHAGVMRGLRVMVNGCSWPQAMREPAPCLHGRWFAKPSAMAQRTCDTAG